MSQLEKDLSEAATNGDFLTSIQKILLDQPGDDDFIAEIIVTLHNQGKIDCIAEFRCLTNKAKDLNFFLIRHVFENALPYINAPIEQVMDCVQHLVNEAGNDIAAGCLWSPFSKYCEADANRPRKALDLTINARKDYLDFIQPVIVAGSKSDLPLYVGLAIGLTFHENEQIQIRVLSSLGRINYLQDKKLAIKAFSAVEEVAERYKSDQLLGVALTSSFSIYSSDSSFEGRIISLIEKLNSKGDDFVLHAVSEIFASEMEKIPKSLMTIFIEYLSKCNVQNVGTLKNIDHGLRHLISSKKKDLAIKLIEPILIANHSDISVEVFAGFIREVFRKKKQCLNYLVTRWLMSKKIPLCKAIFSIINQNHGSEIFLKADIDQLSGKNFGTYLYVARKSVGWLVFNPISAASYVISLIKEASDDEAEEISHLLFDPLLINNPGKMESLLKKALSSCQPREKELIESAIGKSDKYYETLGSIEEIPELQVSTSHSEAHLRFINRQMSDSYKEAQKDSIVNLIATKQILLYGRSSISYIHRAKDDFSRSEIELHSFSHSIEMPRLEHLDSHGFDYMLRVFRVEGCDQ